MTNKKPEGWNVPTGILCMLLGAFAIYAALFSTGYFIYGNNFAGMTGNPQFDLLIFYGAYQRKLQRNRLHENY